MTIEQLPERINVMRVVSYDVARVVETIEEERRSAVIYTRDGTYDPVDHQPITVEHVLARIMDWVGDDLGTDEGLIYQDENGEEL